MIHILIADEQPIVRAGIKALFADADEIEVVAEVSSASELIAAALRHRPDMILLDLCVKRHQVTEAIETIRRTAPQIRYLIFTTFQGRDEIVMALNARMHGYLLKTDEPGNVLQAIRAVSRGERWLSPLLSLKLNTENGLPTLTDREREVLGEIASGKSNQETADALFISEGTVKFHVNNILTKLGADDRTEAVVIGLQRGLLRLAE